MYYAHLQEPQDFGNCIAVNLSTSASTLVDLGSGLGHLPRRIIQRLGALLPGVRVIAVEGDEKLHDLALLMEAKEPDPRYRLIRLLARVEKDEVRLFEEKLSTALQIDGKGRTESGYVLCGLHCCGDLSQAALKIFHTDPRVRAIVLVGCCYHKMTTAEATGNQDAEENHPSGTFPLSSMLRGAIRQYSEAEKAIQSTVALRLACQWSPQNWSHWSLQEVYRHRIRVYIRSILETLRNSSFASTDTAAFKRVARQSPIFTMPPDTCLASVHQPLPDLSSHWLSVASVATFKSANPINTNAIDVEELTRSTNAGAEVWRFLPGLMALQQLVQPLLEALILADRLWSLEENVDVRFATLVRLFDPNLSPRCMAVVALKNVASFL